MTLATGSKRRSAAGPAAFTLLEVLLVLALLVVAASLAWPVLDRTFADSRLRKAADVVRAIWAQARIDAMAYGRTHAFVCREGTGEFNYDVWSGDDLLLDQAEYAPLDESLGNDRNLPLGLSFVSVDAVNVVEGREESESGFQQTGGAAAPAGFAAATPGQAAAQLPPILFFADGTASDAQLVIANERGRQVTVTLRGLTGVSLAGDVQDGETSPAQGARR